MADSKRNKAIPAAMQAPPSDSEVRISMALSTALLAATIAAYIKYYDHLGIKLPKLSSEADRFFYTVKLQIFPLATLLLGIFNVMSTRLRNPAARNPLSGNEMFVEKAAKILQNTVEQLIFFIGNILIFALQVPDKYFYLVPLLVGCFTFGRIAFLIGYSIHPKHRAIGFTFSFGPSHILLWYNLIRFCGCV